MVEELTLEDLALEDLALEDLAEGWGNADPIRSLKHSIRTMITRSQPTRLKPRQRPY